MRKQATILAIAVVAVIWVIVSALSAAADSPAPRDLTRRELGSAAPLQEPTIPAEPTAQPPSLQISLSAGPERICPGWNIYYTLQITNTHSTQIATGILVTASLPADTWYNEGEIGGTLVGAYDSVNHKFNWSGTSLAPGSVAKATLVLHTYSSVTSGTSISNTFEVNADGMGSAVALTVGNVVDRTVCGATPTPSATATKEPTATPTATLTPTNTPIPAINLPLVARQALLGS